MTASGFVTTPDCLTPWPTAETHFRATFSLSSQHGSHHTNLNMKTDKHVCSPQCFSSARDACRRTYMRGLQKGSWSTMVLAKAALEYLSMPAESHRPYCPGAAEIDAVGFVSPPISQL